MRIKFWTILLLALINAACASIASLRPGESTLEDVQRIMGEPAMRWQEADGSSRLAYPQGPAGVQTFMIRLDPAGRVLGVEDVLDTEHFAAIKPGMDKEQVLRLLGPPQPHWTVYFKARDELAWEWRYCDSWNTATRFAVLFDGTAGTVRSTVSVREQCGRAHCACARWPGADTRQ